MKLALICILLFLIYSVSSAQQYSLTGVTTDGTSPTTLLGVSVFLYPVQDTTQRRGVITDLSGRFTFTNLSPGKYRMKISYVGYTTQQISVDLKNSSLDMGTIAMAPMTTTLKGVEIKGTAIRVEQKGDTLQYNANAYKTTKDATAEDLITKMPGLTSDNTGIKAQGETVQKVLVDGKEFFGDDAALALKNLPAEIIEKIEVFDRMSEQSQLSGFDDGQTSKTLNIVTRKGRNNGQFGRVYAGLGEKGQYSAGGNINSFKGDRKLSLVGITNNVNQQNFSTEDLLGVTSATGNNNNGGGGQRGGRGGGRGGNGGGGDNNGNNFSVGQQSGISTTSSIGLNYSDKWGEKTAVTGSYFFNQSNNERITDLSRNYITQRDTGLVYTELNRANSLNYNHRVNLRVEYTIDSVNSIVITPRFSFQGNDSRSSRTGNYSGIESEFNRLLNNQNRGENTGYNFSNNLVYRHRFAKRGRSVSLGITTEINNRDGNSSLYSVDQDQSTNESQLIDQLSKNYTDSYTLSANLAYNEPIGKRGQFQLNYTPTYRVSTTNKTTFNYSPTTESYSRFDTLLTNALDNNYLSQRGGLGYRYNNRKLNFNGTLNYQEARLNSQQDFPYPFSVDRSFQNILPQFTLNYRFTATQNLRVMYRTSTNAPSISQLQNVVDNQNPLFLRTGNPELSQDFTNNLTLRYGKTNPTTSASFFLLVSGSSVQDYITNTSIIAATDTTINGIELSKGTQLSFPVNMSGYRNARTLVTYGLPVKIIKSNLNVNTGFNYNRIPALINGATNLANNYSISQGLVASSNISEKLDFTLSYTANYTVVKNSLQKQADNNYLNQTTSFRLNWIFWKNFVFSSNLNNSAYKGLSAAFNQSIWFWNAGLGYKFLKDQSLEVKLNVFDILNQNNNIARDVTETYIEDRQTNALKRYFLLTVTYRISRFKDKN